MGTECRDESGVKGNVTRLPVITLISPIQTATQALCKNCRIQILARIVTKVPASLEILSNCDFALENNTID